MGRSSVRIKTSAIEEIEAISPKTARQRIVRRIATLGENPRPPGSEKLAGDPERYRRRQGRYRIVYSIDDAGRVVEVFKVGHRRDVYRRAAGRRVARPLPCPALSPAGFARLWIGPIGRRAVHSHDGMGHSSATSLFNVGALSASSISTVQRS